MQCTRPKRQVAAPPSCYSVARRWAGPRGGQATDPRDSQLAQRNTPRCRDAERARCERRSLLPRRFLLAELVPPSPVSWRRASSKQRCLEQRTNSRAMLAITNVLSFFDSRFEQTYLASAGLSSSSLFPWRSKHHTAGNSVVKGGEGGSAHPLTTTGAEGSTRLV